MTTNVTNPDSLLQAQQLLAQVMLKFSEITSPNLVKNSPITLQQPKKALEYFKQHIYPDLETESVKFQSLAQLLLHSMFLGAQNTDHAIVATYISEQKYDGSLKQKFATALANGISEAHAYFERGSQGKRFISENMPVLEDMQKSAQEKFDQDYPQDQPKHDQHTRFLRAIIAKHHHDLWVMHNLVENLMNLPVSDKLPGIFKDFVPPEEFDSSFKQHAKLCLDAFCTTLLGAAYSAAYRASQLFDQRPLDPIAVQSFNVYQAFPKNIHDMAGALGNLYGRKINMEAMGAPTSAAAASSPPMIVTFFPPTPRSFVDAVPAKRRSSKPPTPSSKSTPHHINGGRTQNEPEPPKKRHRRKAHGPANPNRELSYVQRARMEAAAKANGGQNDSKPEPSLLSDPEWQPYYEAGNQALRDLLAAEDQAFLQKLDRAGFERARHDARASLPTPSFPSRPNLYALAETIAGLLRHAKPAPIRNLLIQGEIVSEIESVRALLDFNDASQAHFGTMLLDANRLQQVDRALHTDHAVPHLRENKSHFSSLLGMQRSAPDKLMKLAEEAPLLVAAYIKPNLVKPIAHTIMNHAEAVSRTHSQVYDPQPSKRIAQAIEQLQEALIANEGAGLGIGGNRLPRRLRNNKAQSAEGTAGPAEE